MTNKKIPHLTGGILFNLILESRKIGSKSRKRNSNSDDKNPLTESEIMLDLLEIFVGERPPISQDTLKKDVSEYKKCKISSSNNLVFENTGFISEFQARVENLDVNTLDQISKFIDNKLAKPKLVWLLSAIIETILDDDSILPGTNFITGEAQIDSKADLENISDITIEYFLLSVLSFLLVEKNDNTFGRDTFEEWYGQKTPNTRWTLVNENLGRRFMGSINVLRFTDLEQSTVGKDCSTSFSDEAKRFDSREQIVQSRVLNQYANKIVNIDVVENLNL